MKKFASCLNIVSKNVIEDRYDRLMREIELARKVASVRDRPFPKEIEEYLSSTESMAKEIHDSSTALDISREGDLDELRTQMYLVSCRLIRYPSTFGDVLRVIQEVENFACVLSSLASIGESLAGFFKRKRSDGGDFVARTGEELKNESMQQCNRCYEKSAARNTDKT